MTIFVYPSARPACELVGNEGSNDVPGWCRVHQRPGQECLAAKDVQIAELERRLGDPPKKGRPRKITAALLEQAESLRKEGLTWREVGERLSSKPGTLRRSTQRLLSARRAAQNVQ